jgi:hypothetical protein
MSTRHQLKLLRIKDEGQPRTRQQAVEYQNYAMRIIFKASPPVVLSWFDYAHHDPEPGRRVGGPVPSPSGFPLKACGNDGIRREDSLNAASAGNRPKEIQRCNLSFRASRGIMARLHSVRPVVYQGVFGLKGPFGPDLISHRSI